MAAVIQTALIVYGAHRRKSSQPFSSRGPELFLLIPFMRRLRELLHFAKFKCGFGKENVDSLGEIGANVVHLSKVFLL